MTNERGVQRDCANKQWDAWKQGPETSDLSLPSVPPPFFPSQNRRLSLL